MTASDDSLPLATWTDRLIAKPIPVRAATIQTLESLRAHQDQVDANNLGEIVASDPLMTLRLMANVQSLRGARQSGMPQTVTASLVWLGIEPFFRSIVGMVSVEQALGEHPAALQRVERQLNINRRAARLALVLAMERGEADAALMHHAALLDDFPELLFRVHEPTAALQIASLQEADPSISPADAQRQILGIELADLKLPLSRALGLPRLLEYIDNSGRAEHASARCVEFAMSIAVREGHSEKADPSIEYTTDDSEALMIWLDVSPSRLRALLSDNGS